MGCALIIAGITTERDDNSRKCYVCLQWGVIE
jgi:hypothetical protein